jgi:RNA recognition motif-containing protein
MSTVPTEAAEPYDYAAYAAWWHSVYGQPAIQHPENNGVVTVNGQSQPAPPASFEQQKALYVGNLDTRVNEGLLNDVFSTAGMVSNVKIVVDRNVRTKTTKKKQAQKHNHYDNMNE